MSITVGAVFIPIILTLILLGMMFRPYTQSGNFDFGLILRLFWIIPILFVWMVYFAILAFFR